MASGVALKQGPKSSQEELKTDVKQTNQNQSFNFQSASGIFKLDSTTGGSTTAQTNGVQNLRYLGLNNRVFVGVKRKNDVVSNSGLGAQVSILRRRAAMAKQRTEDNRQFFEDKIEEETEALNGRQKEMQTLGL